MSPLKKSVFIATTIFLMFFIACGRNTPPAQPPAQSSASISITTQTVKAYVGGSATIPVTAQNTDFTISSVSPSGLNCTKNGYNVTCTPTASGSYTVTVTATADATKQVSATVTVPELEISAGNGQTLYADDAESAAIEFYAACNWSAAVTDASGGVPAWLSISTAARGLAADNSMLQLYGDDDYHEMTATVVSGSAGKVSLKVTLQPNDSMTDRTATITITTSKGEIKVTITQRYTKSDGTSYKKQEIAISISPLTESTAVGVSRTFTVTSQNTDFTISAPPAAGCAKSDNSVVCTPAAAGMYAFTVTATADATKYVSATLTATAEVHEYRTVTFNVDGSITATRQVSPNSSLGSNMPVNPTKTGYDFVGWNTNSSATSDNFTATTLVTSNITVYAIWEKTTTELLSVDRFYAMPNVDIGYEKIKYSFRYGKYDFYYIYLGELRNIPIFHMPAVRYSGIDFQYKFSKTDTDQSSIKTAVTNSSSEAINIVESITASASVGGKLTTELSSKAGVKGIAYAETALKIGGETSWNTLISRTDSGGIQRSTSLTETVEYVTTTTSSALQEFIHDFTSKDERGYYRWTKFKPSDVYLYVIKNNTPGVKEIFYEFREYVIPDDITYGKPFWDFDYSKDNSFDKNNDKNFEFDSSLLESLPKPEVILDDPPVLYTIAYNNNGGVGAMQPTEHVYGIEQKLRKNLFTRDGYIFKGWARSSSSVGAEFDDEKSVKNLTDVDGITITLFAVWEYVPVVFPDTYTTSWQTIRGEEIKKVTAEDNLAKQPHIPDVIYFKEKYGVDLDYMKTNGYRFIDFTIQLQVYELYDGVQEVHLMNSTDSLKPLLTINTDASGGARKYWEWRELKFKDVAVGNFRDHFAIRYGAHGTGADDWQNKDLRIQLVFKK